MERGQGRVLDRGEGAAPGQGAGAFVGRTRMAAEGMQALVDASRSAVAGGVRAVVVSTGHHPLALQRIVQGEDLGTLFAKEGFDGAPLLASKL